MMAVVSLSLAAELLGGRRHSSQEIERLTDHADGLALVIAPQVSGGLPQRAEIEAVLRPSIGSLGVIGVDIHRVRESGTQQMMSMGVAPDLAPPRAGDAMGPRDDLLDAYGLIVIDRQIPTFTGDGTRGDLVLRLIAQPSPWTRGSDWRETLILASGVAVVLLVLGGLLVEVQVLRPLREVRAAATQVALGNLDARVPDEGPTEVQSLAQAFNRMTEALRQKLEEIEAQRERLVRAEQLASIGRLSAGVAHEVGNPLAAILGYVELLLDPRTEPKLSAEQQRMLERTRDQIQRIQGIVGQLLAYSRPSRKDPQPVDIGGRVRGLISLLEHDPRIESVAIDVKSPEAIEAMADPALLEQVLRNLILNACRAMATTPDVPSRIEIRVGRDDEHAWIETQDTGPGVPEEARPQLFEPFFTTAKAGEGTGLGLAICQGLVHSMDGSLTCLPTGARPPLAEGLPEGAVFRITLPLVGSA